MLIKKLNKHNKIRHDTLLVLDSFCFIKNLLFIIRKSKNPAKPKRKVQNPAKIGENHNSKRLLKYKSRNIGMIKKSIGSQANPMLFFAY